MWRWLYSNAWPHELPPDAKAAEPPHPLPAKVWQRLYFDRVLDGQAMVPCFLHSASTMAKATLDPGAMRLIEAYLRRNIQQLASMFGALLHPPTEPVAREAALAECARLLDASECATIRAAKMILKQLHASKAFGCDGGTLWAFEQYVPSGCQPAGAGVQPQPARLLARCQL